MGLSGSKETATKWFDDYVKKELPPSCFSGKTVVVTGCTSGTGYVLAETCVLQGADKVLLLNRPSERATAAEKKLQELAATSAASTVEGEATAKTTTTVEAVACDLQDFASVRQAAELIKAKYEAIDVLCNNAGVMALEDIATKDGYDIQLQTNHLSHFLLTLELFPLLKRAVELRNEARVVHHSSMARTGGPLKAEYFEKNGGNLGGNSTSYTATEGRWQRYHQSKLANAAMTLELSNRLKESSTLNGLKAVVAAPGLASTNLQQTSTESGGMGSIQNAAVKILAQSGKDGTMPLLAACFHPTTENGDFWEPGGFGYLYGIPIKVPYDKNSLDPEQRSMLWTKSEEACGEFKIA